MSIEITDRLIGIWSVSLDDQGDWLASLNRNEQGDIELDYRFRYYVDGQAFSSNDEKRWYKLRSKTNNEEIAVEKMRKGFEFMKSMTEANEGWELLKGSMTVDEYMEALAKMPNIHMKTVKKEEYDKQRASL